MDTVNVRIPRSQTANNQARYSSTSMLGTWKCFAPMHGRANIPHVSVKKLWCTSIRASTHTHIPTSMHSILRHVTLRYEHVSNLANWLASRTWSIRIKSKSKKLSVFYPFMLSHVSVENSHLQKQAKSHGLGLTPILLLKYRAVWTKNQPLLLIADLFV